MKLEITIRKEGNHVLIRNDRFHINTFGKNLKEALTNFQEALLLNLEDRELDGEKMPLKIASSTSRTKQKIAVISR